MPRAGAVHISLPSDIATAHAGARPIAVLPAITLGRAPSERLAAAATLLSEALAPVVLLGVRASESEAAAAVRRLLHVHPLPVVMTFEAAGTLSRDLVRHFVGRVGYVHNQPGDEVLRRADVVLTVGYDPIEYDPTAWLVGSGTRVIHLDALPATIDRAYRPELELIGDIGSSLDELSALIRGITAFERPEVAAARRALLAEQSRGETLSGSPVHPLRFIHDLRAALDDDVTVTCDVGAHEIWMARYFFCYEPRHLLFSIGHQTMGVALPWAIGAALARPGKPVVSVSGDGSFLMTCMELETAVRLRLPTVHVVWRDDAYNLIRSLQTRDCGRSFGAEFGPTDFVKRDGFFTASESLSRRTMPWRSTTVSSRHSAPIGNAETCFTRSAARTREYFKPRRSAR
jgi:acetolactate synthase I/II/III large subunit